MTHYLHWSTLLSWPVVAWLLAAPIAYQLGVRRQREVEGRWRGRVRKGGG